MKNLTERAKDLRDHYEIGDKVMYLATSPKPGIVTKVTKGTIKIKYNGYSLTLSKVKLPAFLNDLTKINEDENKD